MSVDEYLVAVSDFSCGCRALLFYFQKFQDRDKDKLFSSMALKPTNIHWIILDSHSNTEKSCIPMYKRQFLMNIKIKKIK